jgi:hypothetical protein
MKKYLYLLLISVLVSCKKDNANATLEVSRPDEKSKGITKISYYNDKGKLDKTLEYINLCGKKYLNQGWYFDGNGDTLSKKSNFYKLEVEKNVIKYGDSSKVTLIYNPLLKNTVSGFLLSREYRLQNNYCNLNEIEVDTLYFVDNKLEFYAKFKNKGKRNIGGYILEVSEEIRKDRKYSERKVYLTIPFEVK